MCECTSPYSITMVPYFISIQLYSPGDDETRNRGIEEDRGSGQLEACNADSEITAVPISYVNKDTMVGLTRLRAQARLTGEAAPTCDDCSRGPAR